MKINPLPALWLIVLIVGLPQLTETVYTPSLPAIAYALQVAESWVEYTLTIYLFAFAIGTLFWGKISDIYGRKPCLLIGLSIYIIGCVGCYYSTSLPFLMLSRFIQAFGGSVGSVLGQAISRDAFKGAALGKAYSSVGSALAIFPAIGPVIGGIIDQAFGWSSIFLFLIGMGCLVWIFSFYTLPETHFPNKNQSYSFLDIGRQMLSDRNVWGCGLIVAGCNGITFSYYAEGPFFLINLLGLSPAWYGMTYLFIALAMVLGGIISRHLHQRYTNHEILRIGLITILIGTCFFAIGISLSYHIAFSNVYLIVMTIVCMMVVSAGICISCSNALSMALQDYRQAIGTASALFGFCYYLLISAFTLGMGNLHNMTLWPMPWYFLSISVFMVFTFRRFIRAYHHC
jgi:Bcr/CflA subfamily drug resistance transporter